MQSWWTTYWVVQAPVLQIVEVPLADGLVERQGHPMPLSFEIAKKRRLAPAAVASQSHRALHQDSKAARIQNSVLVQARLVHPARPGFQQGSVFALRLHNRLAMEDHRRGDAVAGVADAAARRGRPVRVQQAGAGRVEGDGRIRIQRDRDRPQCFRRMVDAELRRLKSRHAIGRCKWVYFCKEANRLRAMAKTSLHALWSSSS
jgi:hypothetical protein